MAIRPIGRVVVVVEAGTIATMTRTTMHTAPGGGAHAPAHLRSVQAAGAAPTALTARLRGDLVTLGSRATPHGPGPHHPTIAATRESLAARMLRTSQQKVDQRNPIGQQMAVTSRKHLQVNGLTMMPALNEPAQRLRKRMLPLILWVKRLGLAALYGKPSAAHRPLQQRAPQNQDKPPPSAALVSSQKKMPCCQLEIRM